MVPAHARECSLHALMAERRVGGKSRASSGLWGFAVIDSRFRSQGPGEDFTGEGMP